MDLLPLLIGFILTTMAGILGYITKIQIELINRVAVLEVKIEELIEYIENDKRNIKE